jgi:methionyl-tRNA formyltransferase
VGEPTYAEKIQAAEYELDWTRTSAELHRVVRLGRAWTTFRGRRLRVLEARIGDPGTLTSRSGALDGVAVGAGDDSRLTLITVQPEGKRPMDARDWVRGFRPEPGEHLGA